MRRSRSSSNIPLPKSRARSSSLSRPEPSPGLNMLVTPYHLRVVGNSTRKTNMYELGTPVATSSRISRLTGCGSASSLVRGSIVRSRSPNTQSVQKLLSNKHWIAEQYAKVQQFIITSNIFDPEMARLIKPPTINTLLVLFSRLLNELIVTGPINTQNYSDVISKTLKLLMYPGNITASTIKSANTMHGWPQLIFITSWLIDRITLAFVPPIIPTSENKKNLDCQMSLMEYFNVRHNIFNGNNDTSIEEVRENCYQRLLNILEIDFKAAGITKNAVEIARIENNDVHKELQTTLQKNMDLQEDVVQKKEFIKNYQEDINRKEKEIEIEYTQLVKAQDKLNNKNLKLIKSNEQLKLTISSQSCSVKEKLKIIKKIEDLKILIERKQKKLSEYRLIMDDLEGEQRKKISAIEKKVDDWNVLLTKTFLPELKTLQLRDKGFYSNNFLEEITLKVKEKDHLEKQLLEEYRVVSNKLEKIEAKHESILQKNHKLKEESNQKTNLKMEEIQKLKLKQKELISKIEDAEKHQEDCNKKIEEADLKLNLQEITKIELNKKIEKGKHELIDQTKCGLSILLTARNTAVERFKDIDEKMQNLIQNQQERSTQAKQKLENTFAKYIAMQKLMKQAQSIWESNKNFNGEE